MSHRAAPFFYFIVGAPGAGKSSQIEYVLRGAPVPRKIVFDIEHEYGRYGRVFSTTEGVRQAVLAAGTGPFAIVYQPPSMAKLRQRWSTVCDIAMGAGDLVLVVDELAEVDSPSPYEVPAGWKRVLIHGRKRSVRVVAGTQRPADTNKRLRSFATRLRVGMLAEPDDQVDLAKRLRVTVDEVAALRPLEWIELDRLRGAIERGRIRWVRGAPVNEGRTTPSDAKKVSPGTGEGGGVAMRGVAMRGVVASSKAR